MTAFPDMVVSMDGVDLDGNNAIYRWTLTGTNTGPFDNQWSHLPVQSGAREVLKKFRGS